MNHFNISRTMPGLAAVVVACAATAVLAQGYPNRPVRIIVPFSAGGPNDILARAVGGKLGERCAGSAGKTCEHVECRAGCQLGGE